jgi:methylenetetrahydrofolate dehydrogenase (NADP+)/methenyltetrahydrofolate cyclohydrolase
MEIVNGRQIANRIKEEIKELLKSSAPKTLAIFYVGDNSVIDSYVALKKRTGEELGIVVDVLRFANDISEESLLAEIQNAAQKYSGIIVQLPIPENLDKEKVLNAVPENLDVDVLSASAYENFRSGRTGKLPPVVGAVKEIIEEYQIDLRNKKIVIIGKGLLVGKPVSAWLVREGFENIIVDKENTDLKGSLVDADVIISGAGVPSLVTPEMIKDGVVLIDAGTSTSSGKIMGDIDRSCYERASVVAGVPGGVGPLTVVNLFKNLFVS